MDLTTFKRLGGSDCAAPLRTMVEFGVENLGAATSRRRPRGPWRERGARAPAHRSSLRSCPFDYPCYSLIYPRSPTGDDSRPPAISAPLSTGARRRHRGPERCPSPLAVAASQAPPGALATAAPCVGARVLSQSAPCRACITGRGSCVGAPIRVRLRQLSPRAYRMGACLRCIGPIAAPPGWRGGERRSSE